MSFHYNWEEEILDSILDGSPQLPDNKEDTLQYLSFLI